MGSWCVAQEVSAWCSVMTQKGGKWGWEGCSRVRGGGYMYTYGRFTCYTAEADCEAIILQ